MAGNQCGGPYKVSIVGGGGGGGSSRGGSKVVWRRERVDMTEPDLDDVAFLSGIYIYVLSFLLYAIIKFCRFFQFLILNS